VIGYIIVGVICLAVGWYIRNKKDNPDFDVKAAVDYLKEQGFTVRLYTKGDRGD